MRVVLYMRVSTAEQSCEMQRNELVSYCNQRGHTVVAEYVDHGVSGTKASRPSLDRLMQDSKRKKFDAVLVYRFDRFARSARHLIIALEEFRENNIEFISFQENIDTSTPMGRAMFAIISAMAQLERDVIVERIKSGIANAKAKGQKLGRPKKADEVRILELRTVEKKTYRAIAAETGVSLATVQNVLSKSK